MENWTFEHCSDGLWRWSKQTRDEPVVIWSTLGFASRGECLEDAMLRHGYVPPLLRTCEPPEHV